MTRPAPNRKPTIPHFSSGPTAKRPGWSLQSFNYHAAGRSHRSSLGKAMLKEVIDRTRRVLQVPADYRIGIVPASDTGAMEMAMWSLLGARPVAVLAWESFSLDWVYDITQELKLPNAQVFKAPFGQLPDISTVNPDHDIVFPWNGTTSGACVPDATWLPTSGNGLRICDATSAVFGLDVPLASLDVITYSWQKVLGGEAQHGMLIMSPRAIERLQSYTPPWPMPKLFKMTKNNKLLEGLWQGEVINTPSMLCVADALDGLVWAESIGGLSAMQARTRANAAVVAAWVQQNPWLTYLAAEARYRSPTSLCLKIIDPRFTALSPETQQTIVKNICARLEKENVAFDCANYRDAPAGFRFWCGATVEASNLETALPWVTWAWEQEMAAQS